MNKKPSYPIRILLVEDEALIAMLEKDELEQYGYQVIHVSSGIDAVKTALDKKMSFDLILMDIDLGKGIDGPHAAEEILKEKNIPVVFLSSHTDPAIVEKTEKITSYGYVVKNSGITVLDASIKMALKLFQANNAIIEAKEDWESIFQAVGHPTIILTPDHTIIKANNAVIQASGKSIDRIIGRKCFELFHKNDSAPHQCPLDKLTACGQADQIDMEMEAFEGVYLVSCTPITDKKGELIKIIHTATDITERKKAEQENRRLIDVLEKSSDLVSTSTPEGLLTYLNLAGRRMAGWADDEEITGKRIADLHPERALKRIETEGLPAAVERGAWQGETAVLHRGGHETPVSQVILAHKSADGRVQFFSTIMRDITDLINAEKVLRESEQRAIAQRQALAELTLNESITEGNMDNALGRMTEIMSGALNVARASIWMLSEDHSELRCLALYESSLKKRSSGAVLDAGAIPQYFKSLIAESRIYAADARKDARTKDLTESYFIPLGITSLLDAGIFINGRLAGVVSFEHIGPKRNWYADEEAFAGTLASLLSQWFISVEHRKKEEAINEAEELHRKVLMTVPDIIIKTDLEGNIVFVNETVYNKLNIMPAEILYGRNMLDFIVPEDLKRAVENTRLMMEGPLGPKEYTLQFENGNRMIFEVNGDVLYGTGNTPTGMVYVLRDITKRRQTEDALRKSEERYKHFIAQVSDAVYRFELTPPMPIDLPVEEQIDFMYEKSILEECNDAFMKMYNITNSADIIGKTLVDIHGSKDNPLNRKTFRDFIQGGYKTENLLTQEKDASGGVKYFNNNTLGVIENGKLVRTWGTQLDVTDQTMKEKAIKKELVEKDILLKEIHHRIKNNISSIRGMLNLQANTTSNIEAKAILADAVSRISSMGQVYEKLLLTEDYRELSARTYLEDLTESIMNIFTENKKIALDIEIENITLNVKTLFPLGTILNELLTNSMKYAFKSREPGTIQIGLKKEKNEIILFVRDNGIGLPENFDVNQSPGFGMLLIRLLTEQLDGTLAIENKHGVKSTVRFKI